MCTIQTTVEELLNFKEILRKQVEMFLKWHWKLYNKGEYKATHLKILSWWKIQRITRYKSEAVCSIS
jgi:hypothetical protein